MSFADLSTYTDTFHLVKREAQKGVTRETFLQDISSLNASDEIKKIMIKAVDDFYYGRYKSTVPITTHRLFKQKWS